jgi:fatty-acyl-CoA synthase
MSPSAAIDHGPAPVPLLDETIGANLERTVARFGDRPALVSCHQGLRYSYAELDAELDAEVDRVARALIAAGLVRGDRLGNWSPNRAEWALIQYATAKIGVILVNINPAYRTHEVRYALEQSGCRMLVAAPAFKTSDYVAMVDEVRSSLTALERVAFFDGPTWDELLGQASTVDVRALRGYCRDKIAHYKIPRYVATCSEFPMTVTGKIQKFKLREQAIEQLGLAAPAGVETA